MHEVPGVAFISIKMSSFKEWMQQSANWNCNAVGLWRWHYQWSVVELRKLYLGVQTMCIMQKPVCWYRRLGIKCSTAGITDAFHPDWGSNHKTEIGDQSQMSSIWQVEMEILEIWDWSPFLVLSSWAQVCSTSNEIKDKFKADYSRLKTYNKEEFDIYCFPWKF
jgi:hypothetical protein